MQDQDVLIVLLISTRDIARVTLVAYECGTTNFPEYGPFAFTCPEDAVASTVSLWSVFMKVEREAFLWGVGTAVR